MRKILFMPGFWMLLATNIYILAYYLDYPDSIHTIVLLFYIQSVIIGIFNALDMLTVRNPVENSFTVNGKPGNRAGCAGLFFLFHFGFFHFVYLFFLPMFVDMKHLDWGLIRISFWLLLAGSVLEFIYSKRRSRIYQVNIGAMMMMPYARIIPIHLLILAPNFLDISAPLLFIILKILADIIMFVVYQKVVYRLPAHTGTL